MPTTPNNFNKKQYFQYYLKIPRFNFASRTLNDILENVRPLNLPLRNEFTLELSLFKTNKNFKFYFSIKIQKIKENRK